MRSVVQVYLGPPFICSLKTAQKKQENLRKGDFVNSCHKVFLTEVFYRKVESNRIDFPKQIRIKRKYLLSQDDDFREKP